MYVSLEIHVIKITAVSSLTLTRHEVILELLFKTIPIFSSLGINDFRSSHSSDTIHSRPWLPITPSEHPATNFAFCDRSFSACIPSRGDRWERKEATTTCWVLIPGSARPPAADV